ncbi:hypothetical protein TELCIR_03595 [Teladorsagia circumcincta]|uniref:Uncharacterized protein n=1 Tax=Teladorsagia circumcincta TaxID=45464 RepID=A0A2G9UVW7_TELCI|nr:hypothetical protein TELCIR_03595 [Teladorsagia circumcincta]
MGSALARLASPSRSAMNMPFTAPQDAVTGCGLAKRDYTDNELIAACAGKRIIKPAEGYMLVLDSKTSSEAQINALCSRAVYMEICINISNSQFQQIRCPYLRYLVPCMPNRPALRVVNNNFLMNIMMSDSLRVCKNSKPLEIFNNPKLSAYSLLTLKRLCPNCIIRQ